MLILKKNNEVLSLLKSNANYRKLLSTTSITSLTQWGSFIAMLVLLSQITDNGLQLGTLWAVSGLVPIFVSFLLGGLIDRLDTKKSIVICELLKAPLYISFIIVPMLEGWSSWILFFTIRFFIGILQSLTTIARQTIIPEIVEEKNLIVANSLNFTISSSIRLIGAASGGVLITLINVNFFWILTAISFIYASIIMKTLKIDRKAMKSTERNFIKEIKVGLVAAKESVFIRYVLLFALTGGLIIGSFNLMIEQMVSNIYQIPPIGISVLYVAEGLTSVLLGYWIANNKILFKNVYRYGYIYIFMGLTWALFGFTNNIFQGSLVMIAFAFVGGFVVPFERQIMQTNIDSKLRGRIFGIWNTCSMVSMQIGALLTGVIIHYIGLRYVTLIVAILEIFLGVLFIIQFKSKRKSLDQPSQNAGLSS